MRSGLQKLCIKQMNANCLCSVTELIARKFRQNVLQACELISLKEVLLFFNHVQHTLVLRLVYKKPCGSVKDLHQLVAFGLVLLDVHLLVGFFEGFLFFCCLHLPRSK